MRSERKRIPTVNKKQKGCKKIHKPPTKAWTRKTKRPKQPEAANKEKVEEKPRKESGRKEEERKKREKHR